MIQPVIVDTDILIDFGMDKTNAVQTLALLEDNYQITISVITAMELYTGCRSKKDLKQVDELLADIPIRYITELISETAFGLMKEFRSSHGVEINDMLIAATAIKSNSLMMSKNKKHYKFLPSLDLLDYPLLKL